MKIKKLLNKKLPLNDKAVYVLSIVIILLMLDISQMPGDQVSAKALLFTIRQYQHFISPNLNGFIRCKFQATCSHYAYTSIQWYGSFWG